MHMEIPERHHVWLGFISLLWKVHGSHGRRRGAAKGSPCEAAVGPHRFVTHFHFSCTYTYKPHISIYPVRCAHNPPPCHFSSWIFLIPGSFFPRFFLILGGQIHDFGFF